MTARAKKGTGTVRERNGRWQAIYRFVDERGKRHQRSKMHGTTTEARRWLTKEIGSVDAGDHTDDKRLTVASYLDAWLTTRSVQDLAPNTRDWYSSAVKRHIVPALGHKRLDKLNAVTLDAFLTQKQQSGRLDGSGGLSASSVRRLRVTLHRALKDAVAKGLLRHNPMDLVNPVTMKRRDVTKDVWSPDQLAHFLDATRSDDLAALWHLAVMTGMRRGECLGLNWRDVNLATGVLSVRQTWVMNGGSPRLSEPKTKRSNRAIELDAGTVAVLQSHRVRQLEQRLAAGSAWQDRGFVFTRADGEPLRPDWVGHRFERLAADAGLPRLTFHGLRHSHATALLAAGEHVKVVSERLGHYSSAFTLDTYASVLKGMQRDAVERLATVVGPKIGDG